MNYLKINGTDFSSLISGLKIGYETLVSDNELRNANGDMTINIINRKVKVYATLRHTFQDEMETFLTALDINETGEIEVSFLDPKTNAFRTIKAYAGTPEPEYYTIQPGNVIYKPMSLNFIEL